VIFSDFFKWVYLKHQWIFLVICPSISTVGNTAFMLA